MAQFASRVGVTFFITCIISAVCTVSGEYTVEIRLRNFTNPSDLLANGECCDLNITLGDGSCALSGCDSYFYHCLRVLGSTGGGCSAGGQTSAVNYNNAPLNFSEQGVLGLPNPLPLPGLAKQWNGIQYQLEVYEFDHDASPKLIMQRITHEIPYGSLSVGVESDPIRFPINGDPDRPSVVLSFRIACAENFYGVDCSLPCNRSDCNGNGHCRAVANSSDYVCVCNPGFSGEKCEMNIDECQTMSIDCSGNGKCMDGINNFTCTCDPGFTGELCEMNINNCELIDNPCSGHGKCVDLLNAISCICEPGYTGQSCEVTNDIDDCVGVNCSEHGHCVDGTNNYTCICDPGYTGANCDIHYNISECETDCNGRGVCVDGGKIKNYSCICDAGFTGADCDINIDECETMGVDCNGRGTCIDGINDFSCFCESGYTGIECETNIDDCIGIACSDQGQCQDRINGYTCLCNPGFTGQNCSANINECELMSIDCNGRGECLDSINEYTCRCNLGFVGKECELNIDECSRISCSRRGQCMDGVNDYVCTCDPGFTGKNCEVDIDECTAKHVDCSRRGQCRDGINSYTCVCDPGFTGMDCKIDINECMAMEVICSGRGLCMDGINSYSCQCDPGFTGDDCEVDINECAAVHANCSGRGQCKDGVNSYTCVCDPGFIGKNCEVDLLNECEALSIKCSGHGRCEDDISGYYCVCDAGFTGATCNQAILDDGTINNEDKDLLELEIIGGVFTGVVAFGLILVIVLGIMITVVGKSKRGSKATPSLYGPYDDLHTRIPPTSSPKLSSTSNNNRRPNDDTRGQWHKFDNPLYRDPSIKWTSSLGQTTSSALSEPMFDDANYTSASVPLSSAHSTQSASAGLASGDRANNSPEHRFDNPIYASVNDTLNNGDNVLHTVGGTGTSLMHLPPNGQQRTVSQIIM